MKNDLPLYFVKLQDETVIQAMIIPPKVSE